MTIESSVSYDDPSSQPRWFKLYVGNGPKYATLGCCFGGYLGTVIPGPQPPPPPGAISPAPAPAPKQPQAKTQRTFEVDAEGAEHPKQYLTAAFSFDEKGRLDGFNAEGSGISDGTADNEISEIVRAHPEMTDAQVVATLKEHGVKYGPNDQEEFTRNLPLQRLERFLGKLQLESVSFDPLDERGSWAIWTVEVSARQKDGSALRYRMLFGPRDGRLHSFFLAPPTQDQAPAK